MATANASDGSQWLFDIAENQIQNPTSHLVITDRILMSNHLDHKRPLLGVRIIFANYGVHDLIVSNPEGYPYFGAEKSDDFVHNGLA